METKLPALADFFPGGVVAFVPPPFDERYWSHFGIPARCRVDLWGGAMARGLAYRDVGIEHAGPGQPPEWVFQDEGSSPGTTVRLRTFGGSRKKYTGDRV